MHLGNFAENCLEEFRERLYRALEGLTYDELNWRPDPQANSIAFIVWHVSRVEDRWFQKWAQDVPDIWVTSAWFQRLGIPEEDTGIRYGAERLAGFPALSQEDLRGYLEAVRAETLRYLRNLTVDGLEFVPSRLPFPELPQFTRPQEWSIGRMFQQLVNEEFQHLGQVNYLRGLQRGLGG